MVLSKAEKIAFSNVVQVYDQDGLDGFLFLNLDMTLGEISSAAKPMPVIAIEFLKWLEAHPLKLIPALNALVTAVPNHPDAHVLADAITRIKAAAALIMPATPWEVSLVEGVPMVNRTRLRKLLQDIVGGYPPPVVRVDGPRGTGRSHSRYLIKHVAAFWNIQVVDVDLEYLPAERRNLPDIVGKMVQELKLDDFEQPTSAGATAETVGGRFADDFASAWRTAQPGRAVWFIFDSLDHHRLAEVRAFVSTLVELRLRHEIGNCVVFLLGAGPDYVFEDPYLVVGNEQLGIFSSAEIAGYISALNQLGRTPLSDDMLGQRTLAITGLLGSTMEHEACKAICAELARLRVEVNA